MLRNLQKHGNSRAIILTQDMLSHLGAQEVIDIAFEAGKLVITAPERGTIAPRRRRQSFREATEATMNQYDTALANLAK